MCGGMLPVLHGAVPGLAEGQIYFYFAGKNSLDYVKQLLQFTW